MMFKSSCAISYWAMLSTLSGAIVGILVGFCLNLFGWACLLVSAPTGCCLNYGFMAERDSRSVVG